MHCGASLHQHNDICITTACLNAMHQYLLKIDTIYYVDIICLVESAFIKVWISLSNHTTSETIFRILICPKYFTIRKLSFSVSPL